MTLRRRGSRVLSDADLAAIAPAARAAQAPVDPAWAAHLRRQQLDLLARQWTRSPFAIVIACAFVAYTVRNHAPLALVGGWTLVLTALLFARRRFVQALLREPPADTPRALDHLVWFAFANGLLTGIAAPLFFTALPGEERALLTMILVCWTAGGVATAAAYARAFYAYVAPALLPIAALWALTGVPANIVLAVLIVLFGLIQVFFVRDNERVVHESFLIRYENERLLDALERERQEVLLARDRAEEASRAKSHFLAAASHDLRQPLHALSLYSAALSLRTPDGPVGEIAGHIVQTLDSLSALLDSLLDISRLDAGAVRPELRRVNVKAVLERIEADFRPVASAKGLAFRVTALDTEVETDPVLLERVVRNLVDNAFKYTAAGSVMLATESGERTVRITVRDTGAGIPAAERERIFGEFYQIGNPERDRSQGLGLGLSIVQRLARLLGLQVELDSEPGRGSTFAITLAHAARSGAASPGAPAPAKTGTPVFDAARVLVIDDEPAVRLGMRTLLELWGCRVAACSGYAEAERLIDDDALDVDLIIADFRLRQGESGIETVHRLRARLGDVPALLVSGDTAPERLREAQASGMPLLHKPVPADKLKQAMAGVLRR